MNKPSLEASLAFLFEEQAIGMELFFVLKKDGNHVIRRADLGDNALPEEIKRGFISYISDTTFKEHQNVHPLSSLVDSKDAIHHYDLNEIPANLNIMYEDLDSDDIPMFNFNNDNLRNIEAFLIKLSSVDSKVILYKKLPPINVLTQSKILYVVADKERFTKPDKGIIKFSFDIDFMLINDQIMVYDLRCLEKFFSFDNIITNHARTIVNQIRALDLIENIEELETFASERSGARYILRLRPDSPVLGLNFSHIKMFVENHRGLRKRIKFNDSGTRFLLHTKVSREYIINLLNDNYLTSDLTSVYYETKSKDQMNIDDDESEPESE